MHDTTKGIQLIKYDWETCSSSHYLIQKIISILDE